MKIKLLIFTPNKKEHGYEPERFNFEGNYAIETMLIKISEKFFGCKISKAIEDLLKERK